MDACEGVGIADEGARDEEAEAEAAEADDAALPAAVLGRAAPPATRLDCTTTNKQKG